MTPVAELSDADLTTEITSWAGRVAAGEARLLALIGEMDERESWFSVGFLSCAHWLSARLGYGIGTARERVRVARALRDLPLIAQAFGSGRMSYAQVRAATRVATVADQQSWVELAGQATGSQLERLARGVARVDRQARDEADPAAAIARLRTTYAFHDDGTFTMTYRGSAADGAVLLAAAEAGADDLRRLADQEEGDEQDGDGRVDVPAGTSLPVHGPRTEEQQACVDETRRRSRSDLGEGLLHLARTGLEALGRAHPESARRSRSRLSVQVDPLSGWARLRNGELLPPGSLKEVAKAMPSHHHLRPVSPRDLRVHDQGRAARNPSLLLRELLGTVDGERCRMPGCTRVRRLHAHHVVHWEDGGPTDLANLVLVCSRHHTMIHQHGYRLVLRADRALRVWTADGTRLMHLHAPAWDDLEALPDVPAGTLRSGESDQRLDLGYAVHVLSQHAA